MSAILSEHRGRIIARDLLKRSRDMPRNHAEVLILNTFFDLYCADDFFQLHGFVGEIAKKALG